MRREQMSSSYATRVDQL
ncbi:hypothetical protein LT719_00850 [Pseudomonas syringae pv. syringae]|nr:hypothetical protein [Pseudomonas syringae pv. syringae]